MKFSNIVAILLAMVVLLTACGTKPTEQTPTSPAVQAPAASTYDDAMQIVLSDSGITVDGAAVSTDVTAAVYTANDIVYYESGKD
ncbi:MAG: hypothetical protein E7433_06200, partial [Ruminococcaceae bacterium]|nr:hypothetical protein [Oscillospiraceae bacterium]